MAYGGAGARPERAQTVRERVRAHISRAIARPRGSLEDWADMASRIADKAVGCDRNGEWLLANMCAIVVPPTVPSTIAIIWS